MTAAVDVETGLPEEAVLKLPEVILKPRNALPFFNHHPWVYQGAVHKIVGDVTPGAEVLLRSDKGHFIARGLFNPFSNIRVRLYSWNETQPLDESLWSQRLDDAIALRRALYGEFSPDLACRLVNSEGDLLSGLTIDRYGDWLLVQLTSLALYERKDLFLKLLQEKLQPKGIWLRTEKGIRAAEGLEVADGLLAGEPPPRPLFISENGIRFGLDVAEGQKTGFFLDQRENRLYFSQFVRDAKVLDMFSYTGGFALNALVHGGAREVVAVDVSESALQLARSNADLNGVGDRLKTLKSDGFKALEGIAATDERFDAVILDPPKMARHRAGVDAALRGYLSLNQLAMNVIKPGGWLLTCSCSGHVDQGMFLEVLGRAAIQAGRHLQFLAVRGPSSDHPRSAHCLESDYLKCVMCRVV